VIYEYPSEDEPIKQGDIFIGIPKVAVEFAGGIPTAPSDDDLEKTPWEDIVERGESVTTFLAVEPVRAIVVSQNCDARWSDSITLCEIKKFSRVEGKAKNATRPKAWANLITKQARINLKWFYLPPNERIQFEQKMAVDFRSTIRVFRRDLEKQIGLRKGRLNQTANDHFRERIAHFYRRYAYNEWYPLDANEMEYYAKDRNLEPEDWYDYQKQRPT